MSRRHPLLALAAAAAVWLAACGGDDSAGQRADTSDGAAAPFAAQVASYDLAAGAPQRFLVGLVGADGGDVVGGEVELEFRYLGADAAEVAEAGAGEEVAFGGVRAAFLPVANGTAPGVDAEPRPREGGEGVGVYEAREVTFDRAGYWEVTVHATVAGEEVAVAAAFEVLTEHQIVDAGDPAPRTVNLLPGDPEAPPTAIDSRSGEDGTLPDPELHRLTVADAIATGRPTLVVVSTPVYCVSRFCGPITDSVQALATKYGNRANFIHLEVWKDFEGKVVNRGAAEWIYPESDADAREPWVFLIDGDGTLAQRWDNVANQQQVDRALGALLD